MNDRLCTKCRYCVWVQLSDGQAPFCNNPATKEQRYPAPIGFLAESAEACELYEAGRETERVVVV